MRIWHQSFTVLEDLPAYGERMASHIKRVVGPDTEVVLHGQKPGTYPATYPGDDIAYSALYLMHGNQWIAQALAAERGGFDAYAMCTLPNPLIGEIRTLVDIPVVGYGETCFHLACLYGQRFGVLLFIDRMVPLYREQIRRYGLAERSAGIEPVGFTFQDVLPAFTNPGPLIDRFRVAARRLIAAGADVIVPGEMPLNVLLASEGVTRVDDVPLIDGLAATMKMAEMMVELRQVSGMTASRQGWFNARPRPERVAEVLAFYGLDRLGA
ncbi:MAG: racemase [Alphaproteobacteria bacterium]|nr:racemase [Alphaproteobacteria bacterium]